MDLHLLDRGHIEADLNFALDGEVVAVHSAQNPDLEYGEFAVWNLLIDHPEATILWDTGSHPEAGDGHWPPGLYEAFAHPDAGERDLATALAEVGHELADIDMVVQSHLHLDHAGGLYNFEGTEVPVYVHRRELEFAYLSAKSEAGDDSYLAADFDRELNWQVIEGERQLVPGVELLELPGHTPGCSAHTSNAATDTRTCWSRAIWSFSRRTTSRTATWARAWSMTPWRSRRVSGRSGTGSDARARRCCTATMPSSSSDSRARCSARGSARRRRLPGR